MAHFMFTVSSRLLREDERSRVLVWRCELTSLPSPPFVSYVDSLRLRQQRYFSFLLTLGALLIRSDH